MTIFQFVAALALIVVAAELFTNAIEWTGFRLRLGAGATGSLLAALGTALPETTVPVVALIAGDPSARQVATGAVLGAPFLLLTLGVGVTGIAVALRRGAPALTVAPGQARRDLGTFVIAFGLVTLAMVLPQVLRWSIGGLLLFIYAIYVVITLRSSDATDAMPEPLHLMRWHSTRDSHDAAIAAQLVLSIGGLIVGSKLFVIALGDTSAVLHINPLILALVLVPFATELPETLNSVFWVRSNDDSLAFGNVAGSATFQACILGFVGLVFTPWQPGGDGALSAVLTETTAIALLVLMRNGKAKGVWLILAAAPWLAYLVAALATNGHIGAAPG